MSFARIGFEVRPLFSRDEVGQLRSAISDHMDRVAHALLKPYAETAPGAAFDERIERIAEHDQSFAQLLGISVTTDGFRDPAVAGLAHHPRLAELARKVARCDVGERIFRFRANSSALPHGRQAWHSDVSRCDEGECSLLRVTAWIPLDDAGPATGGLEVAPGLRRQPLPHDESGIKLTILENSLAEARTIIPQVKAGHCLLLDRFTPHRALVNRSGKTRWSLVVWLKAKPEEASAGLSSATDQAHV
ncbi:MAG: phytanoyl-CoA dioxygenase family protein [Candidatus Andeanibacterium colombiense]|uniref:Phytanoyl-CoA dioxygenase family protein n=1 Tax=Candidatus Andeanibacterium colombiense TaxID=3121345 RepID=A0AAJ6BMC3_9SPHN|nr:MAG: phytanoyl-CoA dioxygenase family protein [Sphingomonadaceae bacterium]